MQNFDIASLSRTGGRKANEDYADFLQTPVSSCWVLADGLGGHRGGATASKTTVEAALASFRERPEVSADAVTQHVTRAQDALIAAQQAEPSLSQMRSTIVVLVSTEREAVWGHVGDSRLYYVRGGQIAARTRDHSVSQALVDGGQIEAHEQGAHEDRSRLLRCLGKEGELGMTVASPQPLCRGDAFLLCTDGFWESVDDLAMELDFAGAADGAAWLDRMEARLRRPSAASAGDPSLNGTKDNYTATAIRLLDEDAPSPPPHDPSRAPIASWRNDAAPVSTSSSEASVLSRVSAAIGGAIGGGSGRRFADAARQLQQHRWIALAAAALVVIALGAGVWQRHRIGQWMQSLSAWTQGAPKTTGGNGDPTIDPKRDDKSPPQHDPRGKGKEDRPATSGKGSAGAKGDEARGDGRGKGKGDGKGEASSGSDAPQSPAGAGRVGGDAPATPRNSSALRDTKGAAGPAAAPPDGQSRPPATDGRGSDRKGNAQPVAAAGGSASSSSSGATTTVTAQKFGTPAAVPAQAVYRPAAGVIYTSLQEAIARADAGEQIWVGPGDFSETIAPIKKSLTLKGAGRDATRIALTGPDGLVLSGASGGLEDLDLSCAAGDAVLTIEGAFRGTLARLRIRIGDGWGIVINGTASAEIDVVFEGTGKGKVSVRPAAAAHAGR